MPNTQAFLWADTLWKRALRGIPSLLLMVFLSLMLACTAEPAEENEQRADDSHSLQEIETITVYSGRKKSLVGPLLDRASEEAGVKVRVRYGGTAELAAAILEEGNRFIKSKIITSFSSCWVWCNCISLLPFWRLVW